MSLPWKIALVLVMVLAVADSSIHHRHHKEHKQHIQEEYSWGDATNNMPEKKKSGDLGETIFEGHIYCDGSGLDWVVPHLYTPRYPRLNIYYCETNDGGKYKLTTGHLFDLPDGIYLRVRHQCEIKNLAKQKCQIPYYTTQVKFDVKDLNATSISRDFELSTMEAYSTSDCLY